MLLEGQSPQRQESTADAPSSRKLLESKGWGWDSPSGGGRYGAGRLSIVAMPGGREYLTPWTGKEALSAWAPVALPGSAPCHTRT